MVATQVLHKPSRTDRRLQRLGLVPLAVSGPAHAIFAQRMQVRLVLLWVIAVPSFALYAIATWSALRLPADPASNAELQAYGLRAGLSTALFGVVVLIGAEVRRALDRRIADRLPTRVSRAERVGLTTVLGRVRIAYLLVVLLSQPIMLLALFVTPVNGIAAYRWGVTIGLLGCGASAVLGVLREVHRPSVAVDEWSLAVDERMRSQDAFAAVGPLMFLTVTSNIGLLPFDAPGWLHNLGFIVVGACFAMQIWAQQATPWPKPSHPRYPVARPQPTGH